jgi:phosphatidylserine decarboxylase
MSPNVHVTRYAISGIVKFSKYHPGKFLVAWHPKASEENERTTIVIENNTFGSILYRQVAGALARIVNYAEEGMQLSKVLMLVSLNLVRELIFFYLSELQSTLCLISSGRKTIIATKAIEKDRFQEAFTALNLCLMWFICLLQTGYFLY